MSTARSGLTFLILLVALITAHMGTRRHYKHPFEPPTTLTALPVWRNPALDVGGILLGMRRLTADLAWIEVLQYYGGAEMEFLEDEAKKVRRLKEDPRDLRYIHLLPLIQRVIRLDPYDHYPFLFGAAALGWQIKRYDEAVQLIKEGIRMDPTFWPYQLYLGALLYTREKEIRGSMGSNETETLIKYIERAVEHPECPDDLKILLGSLYTKRKQYEKAAGIYLGLVQKTKREGIRQISEERLMRFVRSGFLSRAFITELDKVLAETTRQK